MLGAAAIRTSRRLEHAGIPPCRPERGLPSGGTPRPRRGCRRIREFLGGSQHASQSVPIARIQHPGMRRSLFAFFVVSGFCSLVYEVVWIRLAMASFGVTTPFVSIVLSVFMGGLALGSFAAGRLARRTEQRPPAHDLRLYGAAE